MVETIYVEVAPGDGPRGPPQIMQQHGVDHEHEPFEDGENE